MQASAACAFEQQCSLHQSEGNTLQQSNNLLLVEEHGVKHTAPNLIQRTYMFPWAMFFTVQNKYIHLVINLNDCATQTGR